MGRYQDALTWARGRHDNRAAYINDRQMTLTLNCSSALAAAHHEGHLIRRAYLANTINDAETMLAAHGEPYETERVDDVCEAIEESAVIQSLDLPVEMGPLALAVEIGDVDGMVAQLRHVLEIAVILLARELTDDDAAKQGR